MKNIRILSVALVIISSMHGAPTHATKNNTSSHSVSNHGAVGLHVMPATVQMPGMIQQPVNQVSVMPTQPMGMQQSVPVQQQAQPGVVSDQMFLQNTMNKLLGDKFKIMREKIEKYKKIIQQNASVLEQKVKAFFA